MKKQCKSCPYFLSSKDMTEKLKELAFWLKFSALNKDYTEKKENEEINKELRKIYAVLKIVYNASLNRKETEVTKQ
jgi:hypothetical protein